VNILDNIALGVALYLAVCTIAVLCGFGMLRLLKLEVTLGGLLLSPVITLVFWSITLGIASAWRLPIKNVSGWLWGATLLFAVYGLLRARTQLLSVNLLLLLCAILPIVTMGRYFLNGLSDYLGSVLPDGWSYIAFGQYLWEYPRGIEGGLAPLYQYAAHLSDTRSIAPALLGFLSPLVRAGDTQSVSGLFQAWGLFSMTCAAAFCWLTQKQTKRVVVVATVLAVAAGWMINVIWANNFDNELALAYMPAFAGIVYLLDVQKRRWWLLLGCMVAGLLYTYPELSPFIFAGSTLIALPRFWQERKNWRAWLIGIGITLAVAAILLIPFQGVLIAFVQSQVTLTVAAGVRPGEGLFRGLVTRKFLPAALWGLGGEQQIDSNTVFRDALGFLFSALGATGLVVLARRQFWGIGLATGLFALGVLYYIVFQHYSYAAYKLLSISWWFLALLLAVGTDSILSFLFKTRFTKIIPLGMALLVLVVMTDALATDRYLGNQALSVTQFRQVNMIKPIAGDSPVRILVDDWIANQWAVYFLRDSPTDLGIYRMYMAQSHVIPLMDRASHTDPSAIRYVLTDKGFEEEASASQWQKKWSGGPYTLWQIK
jgi:hypothetical protein